MGWTGPPSGNKPVPDWQVFCFTPHRTFTRMLRQPGHVLTVWQAHWGISPRDWKCTSCVPEASSANRPFPHLPLNKKTNAAFIRCNTWVLLLKQTQSGGELKVGLQHLYAVERKILVPVYTQNRLVRASGAPHYLRFHTHVHRHVHTDIKLYLIFQRVWA